MTDTSTQVASPATRLNVDGIEVPKELITPELRHLYNHASVRSYRPDAVAPGMLQAILAAAVSASTSSNIHSYSIVVVEDQARRARLAELAGKQRFIAEAPVFLAFCPDIWRARHVCQRQGRTYGTQFLDQFCIALGDAHLAMQNAAGAAEALGLGICMIGAVRQSPHEIGALLGLPKGVYCAVGMTVGYATVQPKVKPRLPLKVLVHREQYSTAHLEEGLQEYDETMIASGIYAGREVAIPNDPPRSEPYGWCEHTSRRLSNAGGHSAASGNREYMRQFLIDQGFDLD